jgi:hypothetical protein
MNDQSTVVLFGEKKRLSDPEQVVFILLIERTIRVNASMHEKALAVIEKQREPSKPIEVVPRDFGGAG